MAQGVEAQAFAGAVEQLQLDWRSSSVIEVLAADCDKASSPQPGTRSPAGRRRRRLEVDGE
jgi:hypothetical protein